MLGREGFSQDEIDRARVMIGEHLAAYRQLVAAVPGARTDKPVAAAFLAFEARQFNDLALALDRPFVGRVPSATGPGATALDELGLIVDSLLHNNGVFCPGTAPYVPEQAALHLKPGEPIRLTEAQFEALADAVFADLEAGSG